MSSVCSTWVSTTLASGLTDEVTAVDPNVYTEPWTVALLLTRDESYKIYEYACHEGNVNDMTMLRAGRVQDTGSTAVSESRKAVEDAGKADAT